MSDEARRMYSPSEVKAKIHEATLALETARRMMADTGNREFDAEDCHTVAIAQYHVAKAEERMSGDRYAKKPGKR